MPNIGIWQLVTILVITLLLFDTKRLKNIGGDLGATIKVFKDVIKQYDKEKNAISPKLT